MSEHVVSDALGKIYSRHGKLTEELVVRASKSKSHPLHDRFFWDDDAEAARIGRLEIARQLIRSVRVTREVGRGDKKISVVVRKYPGQRNGEGYWELSDTLSDSAKRERLLAAAFADMMAFEQKYSVLEELEPVFRAHEEARRGGVKT